MGKPILESEDNLKRAKLLLQKFFPEIHPDRYNSIIPSVKFNDNLKLNKIERFVREKNVITPKQFKALKHYCKVYNINILQSIDFLLE